MKTRIYAVIAILTIFLSCNENQSPNPDYGNYVGKLELFGDTGSVQRIAIKPGDEDIIWELNFYENGQLMSMNEIKDGRLYGIRIEFDKSGAILGLGKVKYGVPIGKWYTFDEDGGILGVEEY